METSMWKAVSDIRDHAQVRYKVHNHLSGLNYIRHKNLGVVVTILTTIVGTSVFAALTQNNPNFWVQLITGVLSIIAAVLSAVQSFYGYLDLAEKHKKAAIEFLTLKRRAEIFLSLYEGELNDTGKEKAIAEQQSLLDDFRKVSEDAPIRTDEDYEAAEQRNSGHLRFLHKIF